MAACIIGKALMSGLPPLPPLAVDLQCFADEQPWPMARRFVCFDFETTGIWKRKDQETDPAYWAKLCYNYPIQISVDVVEPDLSVTRAFDALVIWATRTVKFVAETILPQLGLRHSHLKHDLEQHGKYLAEVLRDLADLLNPGDVLVSHNLMYDVGRTLGVNFWNDKAEPHFDATKDSLERILAAPRLCTMLWKTTRPFSSLDSLVREYGVTNDHAHDARGDSKALAECIAAALRQGERLPVCSAPIYLSAFRREADLKWAARGNWIELPPKPVAGIRASLKRGSALEESDREVRPRTEDEGNEASTAEDTTTVLEGTSI